MTGIFVGAKALYMAAMPTHKKRLKKKLKALAKLPGAAELDLIVSFVDDAGNELEGPVIKYVL